MEKTKPINQNIEQRKPSSWSTTFTESNLSQNHLPVVPLWKQNIRKLQRLNYFSFTRFLQGEIYEAKFKQPVNHDVGNLSQKPSRGTMCSSVLGRGIRGGGVVVGEHVRGKAGFCVCDVLA